MSVDIAELEQEVANAASSLPVWDFPLESVKDADGNWHPHQLTLDALVRLPAQPLFTLEDPIWRLANMTGAIGSLAFLAEPGTYGDLSELTGRSIRLTDATPTSSRAVQAALF